MNSEYQAYLNSEAWKTKRLQKLNQSGHKCEACRSNRRLEVHHLTYERIFNEPMEDLMTLCFFHHMAAEECVDKGLIVRFGNVKELARKTLELVRAYGKRSDGFEARNRRQDFLLGEQWLLDSLRLKRHVFKELCRSKFKGHPHFNSMIANCFALYDRKANRLTRATRKKQRRAAKKMRKEQKAQRRLQRALNRMMNTPVQQFIPMENVPF